MRSTTTPGVEIRTRTDWRRGDQHPGAPGRRAAAAARRTGCDDELTPYDTGRDPLNTALDRLRTIVLRGDTTKVALLAAALEILKASDRAVGARG